MAQEVAKVENFDSKLEGVLTSTEKLQNDLNKLAADLESRVEAAKHEELAKEVESIREKIHYACVKKEPDNDINEAIEQVEVLKSTVGSCLMRNEEFNQFLDRIAKDVKSLQRDVGTLSSRSKLVVDLLEPPEVTPPGLEPGEIPECGCKRKRQ